MQWLYEKNFNNSARFVLGEIGPKTKNPLICFGINPSTAKPNDLDRTLARVRNESITRQFDGWVMLNLYPQRATLPKNIHLEISEELHQENLKHIKKIFNKFGTNVNVWAAWGGLIKTRPYLTDCLRDICKFIPQKVRWARMGNLVGGEHPHHPLYLKKDQSFESFKIEEYLEGLE